MDFAGREQGIDASQLKHVLAVAPSESAFRQGFRLNDEDIEAATTTIRGLEVCWISSSGDLDDKTNIASLEAIIRMLQMGLEVQNHDYDDLEEENQGIKDEHGLLRDELQVLQRGLDEEHQAREQLGIERDEDHRRIEKLEQELSAATEELERKRVQVEDARKKILVLQQENEDIRNEAHALALQRQTSDVQGDVKIREAMKHKDWQLDRILRDNKDLQQVNEELRDSIESIKLENLEVSSKIVSLDEEAKQLRVRVADLEEEEEKLAVNNSDLAAERDRLAVDVREKHHLLDQFEIRFQKQFNEWELEKEQLLQEIERVRNEHNQGNKKAFTGRIAASHDSQESHDLLIESLRRELQESKQKEVLLLEAYEQLEIDVGKEVERALSLQGEELSSLKERNLVLEGGIHKSREQNINLENNVEMLQANLEGVKDRNKAYESGIYGLPQAVEEIKGLEAALKAAEGKQETSAVRINKLSDKLEDIADENAQLRRKAGIPPDEKIDISDLKLEKERIISQLRSLASHLESEVWMLEEERRKLKTELRFRAKYHGRHAIDMGLTGDQLLMVEHYVERLKHGDRPKDAEVKLIEDLNKRVLFLEDRLAAAQAYAELPANLQPLLLADPEANKANIIENEILNPIYSAIQALSEDNKGDEEAISEDSTYARVLQILGQASESALKLSRIGGREKTEGPVSHPLVLNKGAGRDDVREQMQTMVAEFTKLKEELEVRNNQLEIYERQNVETTQPGNNDACQPVSGCAPGGLVSRDDYKELVAECAGLKQQLLDIMVESYENARAHEALRKVVRRYKQQILQAADEKGVLCREYVNRTQGWIGEKNKLLEKNNTLEKEIASLKAFNNEVERELQSRSGPIDADNIRKLAMAQMKQTKIAHELQFCCKRDAQLQESYMELQEFVHASHSMYQSRIRHLSELSASFQLKYYQVVQEQEKLIPMKEFEECSKKHLALQRSHCHLLEGLGHDISEATSNISAEEAPEWMIKYMACANRATKAEEECHQLRLVLESSGQQSCVESRLNKEVVDLVTREQTACRRSEMSERAKERAEEGLREAEDRMLSMEKRLGRMQSELESAHRTTEELQQSLEDLVPKAKLMNAQDRILELGAHISELESQMNVAHVGTCNSSRVEYLERVLRQRKADLLELNKVVREASTRGTQSGSLTSVAADLQHMRARESLAREMQLQAENARAVALLQVNRLEKDKSLVESQLESIRKELRQASFERRKLILKLNEARAATISQWKAEKCAWMLKHFVAKNKRLEEALAAVQKEVATLEEVLQKQQLENGLRIAKQGCHLALEYDIGKELRKCEADLMNLKLKKAKLERSEILSREKILYLEKANSELHDIIDRIDQESLRNQASMEADIQEAQSARVGLEEQLKDLQCVCDQLHAKSNAEAMADRPHQSRIQEESKPTIMDQDILLQQIESVKEARHQAESFHQRCEELERQLLLKETQLQACLRDQKDLLERLEQGFPPAVSGGEDQDSTEGPTAAVFQMQSFAESTVREMRDQLAARNSQMKVLQLQMESDRQTYLRQHEVDRKEIEKLSTRLLDQKRDTIHDLRKSLAGPAILAKAQTEDVGSDEGSNLGSNEQLKYLLQARDAQIAELTGQIERSCEQLDEIRADYEHQVMTRDHEIEELKSNMEGLKVARQSKDLQRSWREAERKLRLQLSAKDIKLRHLKEAIRSLEDRLVDALKKNADEVMHESSWREQERLMEQLDTFKAEKGELQIELRDAQNQISKLKSILSDKNREIERIQKKLDRQLEAASSIRLQLNKERTNRRADTTTKQKDSSTTASASANLQKELEETKRKLLSVTQELRLVQEREGKGDDDKAADGEEKQHVDMSPDDTRNPKGSSLSQQRVHQWEESKRLQRRVESLRTQVNKKNQELMQASGKVKELESRIAEHQNEAKVHLEQMQSLKDDLQRSRSKRCETIDLAKVQECLERSDAVEKRSNGLEVENALLKRQLLEKEAEKSLLHDPKQSKGGGKGDPNDESDLEVVLKEQELFEACLRRDQAEAQVKRLKEAMKTLFGGDPPVPNVDQKSRAQRKHISNAREDELLATIQTLKKALERAQQAIPVSKHRQVLEKRKELQKQVTELTQQLAAAKETEQSAQQVAHRCDELQTSNLVLRRQVTRFQELSKNLEECEAQKEHLISENVALKNAITTFEDQSKSPSKLDASTETQREQDLDDRNEVLEAVKDRVVDLELENRDLRKELEGFDPAFFEEIEDLKHEHHQLSLKVAEYEQLIEHLRADGTRHV